jgi:hypothetical protein
VVQVYGGMPPHTVVLASGVYDAWEAYTRAVRYDLL